MDLVMRNKPDQHRHLNTHSNNSTHSRSNSHSPSVDSNNNNNPSSGSHGSSNKCRSLVCDSSGIIIAEMVYRCMICYYVTDSITEAKDHYTMVHMQEEEEEEDESDHRLDSKNSSIVSHHHKSAAAAAAEAMMRFASGSLNRNLPSNGIPSNPLLPDISLFEDHSPLKFGNTSHHLNNTLRQLTQQSNLLKRNAANGGLLAPLPALTGQAQLTNGSSGNSSSNTKSGYVNCAVCGVTRFYSCVQRRYGQFTCVTCYRYFRTFLLKPKKYACPNLGQCPLNVRTRCRACWIKGCISVFSVDSRRQQVLQANLPVKKLSSGSSPSKIPGVIGGSSAASLAGMLSQIQQRMFEQNDDREEEDIDDDREDVGTSPRSGQERLDDNGIEDEMEDEPPMDDDVEKDSTAGFEGSMLEPEVSLTENDDNDGDIDSSVADLSDNNNHSSSFSSQYSPVGKSGGVGLPQHQLNKLIVTGKKVWSCGKCMTCTAEDCGKCIYCLDRPKFGGPFIKKQRCIKRRCLMKIKNNNGNNKLHANTLLRK